MKTPALLRSVTFLDWLLYTAAQHHSPFVFPLIGSTLTVLATNLN